MNDTNVFLRQVKQQYLLINYFLKRGWLKNIYVFLAPRRNVQICVTYGWKRLFSRSVKYCGDKKMKSWLWKLGHVIGVEFLDRHKSLYRTIHNIFFKDKKVINFEVHFLATISTTTQNIAYFLWKNWKATFS